MNVVVGVVLNLLIGDVLIGGLLNENNEICMLINYEILEIMCEVVIGFGVVCCLIVVVLVNDLVVEFCL